MSISLSSLSLSFPDSSKVKPIYPNPYRRQIIFSTTPIPTFPAAENQLSLAIDSCIVLYGSAAKFCSRFYGLKNWILENLNLWEPQRKKQEHEKEKEIRSLQFQDKDKVVEHLKTTPSQDGLSKGALTINFPNDSIESHSSSLQSHSSGRPPSLCIAVIGATGDLARRKIFPALFALYYSGFLPEDVAIFGYSRRKLTDDDLRSIIASTLTCRLDYQHGPLY